MGVKGASLCFTKGMAGLDSLAILQEELQRIRKNQITLKTAIDNDKAIVLHPSQQASPLVVAGQLCLHQSCDMQSHAIFPIPDGSSYIQALVEEVEDDGAKPKKAAPKYVVSGGLTGFGVAQDLLNIDFSPPEEAPEEFRAVPFNEKRVTTLRSGKSGIHLCACARLPVAYKTTLPVSGYMDRES